MSYETLNKEVIQSGLCARCGICAGICPVGAIGFTDDSYPMLIGRCTDCGLCGKVCPGASVDFNTLSRRVFDAPFDPMNAWGHHERMFVGHSADETVRRAGASGGLTTALLLYLLKSGKIRGAVVVGMDPKKPHCARALLATTEGEIRAAAKSKYCIVPSMNVLAQMRKEEGPFAVVALPCQVHGLRKLEAEDPGLAGKIAYILGLYCHYNMEADGYMDAFRVAGINPEQIDTLEFRGGGWPGGFLAVRPDGKEKLLSSINIKNIMTVMFRLYGAERCFLCTDALCELADISLGDFWAIDYQDYLGDMSWCTLATQRTARGKELLDSAERDGAVTLYDLPETRYSKRTMNLSMEKKHEGYVRLRRRTRQGRPVPNYHHEIPATNLRARAVEAIYRSTRAFRQPCLRRMIMRILFSSLGQMLDYINTLRKRIFLHFRGN